MMACQDGMTRGSGVEVGLLTGGADRPYALGLAVALASRGVSLDFIGSDDLTSHELGVHPNVRFLNLRGNQSEDATLPAKIIRVIWYYARLILYAASARPKLFHILWNNKFELFDRTVLLLYYKLRGKKIILTAHNVNASKRDSKDSVVNRLTLKIQYRLADHIFVHTAAMKAELLQSFGGRCQAVTVVPFGLTASVPETDLTGQQARRRLGIDDSDRTILFFGHIEPYKGLAFLVAAFQELAAVDPRHRLIIAGKPGQGATEYTAKIEETIRRDAINGGRVIRRLQYIPEADTELYFKAADVIVLPYTSVSQSGVMVLAYRFGLPVIAADVGSFREDIVEGETGFLCQPHDVQDLVRAIETYFGSDLFRTLESRRCRIRQYAATRYSWTVVSDMTSNVYRQLLLD
jgi:glycosyltransferase involved in cell wall biosynthesis